MQMIHDEPFGIYPHRYMQFQPALTALPSIFNISGDSVVGNGSGYGTDAFDSALGEYIERFHFYNEVTIDITAPLTHLNPPALSKKLFELIQQIQQTDVAAEQHAFDLTEVRNIFTREPAYLPTAMISLAAMDSQDRKFIPFIDSCGQAVHVTKAQAQTAAFKEFLERQALVGAWLSGKARHAIDLQPHPFLGKANQILSILQQHGALYAFDLGHHLPAYSVIIFYFAHDKKDIVQYSVGLAADFQAEDALARALNELWQSYIFMYLNADNREHLDQRYQYLNDLLDFNHSDTQAVIPFLQQPGESINVIEYLTAKKYSEADCFQTIGEFFPYIYTYESSNYYMGKEFNFCKILSPDFFLHMGICMPLNLKNAYAKVVSLPPNLSPENPIPFP
jgi:hypothetical protein